jgi:glycosyltransferase involved in cell wall biosynthesis
MTNTKFQKPVLVGHPFAPIGRGEDIRCSFRAFQAAGLNLPIHNIHSDEKQVETDFANEFNGHLVQKLSNINIFYINGDEVKQALKHLETETSDAYNIICPQWELSIYPQDWAEQLNRFDEIWAPSKFVFDSLQKATSKTVLHMPLPVGVQLTSFLGRRYFHIPESSYIYLFFFDLRSYIDRKNPWAVIKAFEKACTQRPDEDVRLVIKINPLTSSESKVHLLNDVINKCLYGDRIIIVDKVFTDNEIKNLIRCCDCFVSLHRSEGFGRGMAEAMFLEKPVIATGYSGNLDFMNEENSFLVPYKLIDVKEGSYPHAKGQVWAEPDIEHAAKYMIRLLDDRDYGSKIGQIASRYIRMYFTYRPIGLKYKERIDKIISERKFI